MSVWGEIKAGFDRDQSAPASPAEKGTPPWGSSRDSLHAAVALLWGTWGPLLAAHHVGAN